MDLKRVAFLALVSVSLLPCVIIAACPYHQGSRALNVHDNTRSLLDTTTSSYIENVNSLDVKAVKADLAKLLRTSESFWPADFGYYGGLFIRLAWHCSGSYRAWDGRGGCDGGRIRFAPEANWPDNTNLDMARQLLARMKEKYGDQLSWGDLIILAGNVAIESAGGPSLPLCLGRVDDANGTASIELGPSKEQEAIAACEVVGQCEKPLGPTTMGLIYVNPEGPKGQPKPELSAAQIRDTFGRMGMNDSETVALIGGGHAFGKAHGACPAGPGKCGSGGMKGKGNNTFTSGFEGPWTTSPTVWSNEYFVNLLSFNWVVHKGPGGHFQWKPTPKQSTNTKLTNVEAMPKIMMLTADVALTKDPKYLKLVQTFAKDQKAFEAAFAAAWYKLTTRDMGPVSRCVNVDNLLPEALPWQCPMPAPSQTQPDFEQVAEEITDFIDTANPALAPDTQNGKQTYAALFATLALQSASSYRQTDHMGGTNGARIRFSPMKDWADNKGLDLVLKVLEPVKSQFPTLSYADLIVLAGTVALKDAIPSLQFSPGRTDATEACVIDDELQPRLYRSDVISVKDSAKVKGLSLQQYVALFAAPRSPSQQQRIGYSGSWSTEAQPLSNAFFQTLLNETWENSTSAAGRNEYKANGKSLYVTPLDAALVQDDELMAIVKDFANDNNAFLQQFATAWTAIMNAGAPVAAAIDVAAPTNTTSAGPTKAASAAPPAASLFSLFVALISAACASILALHI